MCNTVLRCKLCSLEGNLLNGVEVMGQPCDWTIKMNKKERRLALATALQDATPDMVVVQDLKV